MKKLSKFDSVAKVDLNADIIVRYLDHIFVVSKKAIANLKLFFQKYDTDSVLQLNSKGDAQKLLTTMVEDLKHDSYLKYAGSLVDELPFHLRDINWLTNYVIDYLHNAEPTVEFNAEEVKDFLQKSPAVKHARDNFEQSLIKSLIKCNLHTDKCNQSKNKISRSRNMICYEELFRNKILYSADTLGLDHHRAELTLETNAGLWRKEIMKRGFLEHYYSDSTQLNHKQYLAWYNLAKKHFSKWFKCREFEYFDKHKNILNEANAVTDNMKIGYIRYACLSQELADLNNQRLQMLRSEEVKTNHDNIVNL